MPKSHCCTSDVHAKVASAFAANRNWSVYGQLKSERKMLLSHGRADARIYCHEAMQLHEKLLAVQQDEHALDERQIPTT